MAKITGFTPKIFGSGAGLDQISLFGSLFAGSPDFTTDAAQAQSLSNYLTGWVAAAIDGNSPAIEDMNAVFFVITTLLAYNDQAGVPEWKATTTYYIGSFVNVAGVLYASLTDGNLNNLVSDTTKWRKVGGNVLTTLGDILYAGAAGTATRLAGNTDAILKVLTQIGDGLGTSAAPAWRDFKAPTVTKYLSGSGTYTTPAGAMYLRVRLVGGGGGGGGSSQFASSNAGTGGAGGQTSFGSLIGNAGGGGGANSASGDVNGGLGGTSTVGTEIGTALSGGAGGGRGVSVVTNVEGRGGMGGTTAFGGGGSSGGLLAGGAGTANTGAGGGGASASSSAPGWGGAGGGAGGYVDAIIRVPAATYSYAVGLGGSAGTLGTSGSAGGAGATGYIEVTEFYQ